MAITRCKKHSEGGSLSVKNTNRFLIIIQKIKNWKIIKTAGKFKKEVKDFAGLPAKPKDKHRSTDNKIIEWLDKNQKLFKSEKIIHSYPHCWRCDTPLLNYAASSWFVKVTAIKNKKRGLIDNNKKINCVPPHLKAGRFGKILEEAPDWAVSRSRYWGAPLPVWKCQGTRIHVDKKADSRG